MAGNLGQRAKHFAKKHTTSNRVEHAALMATNFSRSEPRAEFVEFLIRTTYEQTALENPAAVLEVMQDRLEGELQWQPTLKVLFVIHRCLQDGSEGFATELGNDPAVLRGLATFADRSSSEAGHYSKHARVYSEYLEETMNTRADVRKIAPNAIVHLVARKPTRGRQTDVESIGNTATLLLLLEVTLPHLDRLLRCERGARPRSLPAEEDCPLAYAILALLLRDGLHVYRLVSEALMGPLQAFTGLPAEQAVRVFNLYSNFIESTRQFNAMCASMRRYRTLGHLRGVEPPALKPADHERVLGVLNRHLQTVDPDGAVAKRVAENAKRPLAERLTLPVIGQREQLQQLQEWSRRQFPGRASNLADLIEVDGADGEPRGAPVAPTTTMDDLLQLDAPSSGAGGSGGGGAGLLLDLMDMPPPQQQQQQQQPPPPFGQPVAGGSSLNPFEPDYVPPPPQLPPQLPPHAAAQRQQPQYQQYPQLQQPQQQLPPNAMQFGNGGQPQWGAQPAWQQPQPQPFYSGGMPAPMAGPYGGGVGGGPGGQQQFNPSPSATRGAQMQFL